MADSVFWILICTSGLCAGSFLNVVIHRVPVALFAGRRVDLVSPRSSCPTCGQMIAWYDNIPVLSWCLLRGRCRHCRQPVPVSYLLTEFVGMGIALTCAWVFASDLTGVAVAFALLVLYALAVIDSRHLLLPDVLTQLLLWAGLGVGSAGLLPASTLSDGVAGAIAGYGVLWVLREAFSRYRHQEALGLGDVKLAAALGAWTGWGALPVLLLLASSAGIVFVVMSRLLWQRPADAPLPFGPFLSLSGAGMLIFPALSGIAGSIPAT